METVTRPLLNYYGGKWLLADWIISHMPEHELYVEVFGGALSVFMKKPKSKAEVVNDINRRIFNLYKTLRHAAGDLKLLLDLTPYSRAEKDLAQEGSEDPLEDARRTITAISFSIGGHTQQATGFRVSKKRNAFKSGTFRSYVENFMQFHERINEATIENLDWRECITKYDSPQTLFYLDPPYVHSTRTKKDGYFHEFSDQDHVDLLELIQNLKGKVILSGYESEIYDSLNWKKVSINARTNADDRKEVIWLCPKTANEQKQMGFNL